MQDTEVVTATIRPAVRSDVGEVLEFWARAAENEARPTDSAADVERLIDRDPEALVLATLGSEIVGTIIVGWDGWRCHVYRLAVDPERRQHGIGTALLAHAEEQFREAGGKRVDAMVLDVNELGQSIWSGRGYAPQPEWSRWIKPLL